MSRQAPLVWFITGSSQGIGLALTRHVLSEGHKVIATSRSPSKIPSLVSEVERHGGKWLQLDITASDLEQRISDAESIFGRIDVVVNCAGYAVMGTIEDTPITKVQEQMDANFYGPVRVIKTVLPAMRKRRSGVIVNVSSSQSFLPAPVTSAYGASKAALDAFTESLEQEVKVFGIKVLLVSPGAFRTQFATGGADRVPCSEEYAKEDHPATKNLTWMDTLPKVAKGSPELGAKVIYEAVVGEHNNLFLLISAGSWVALGRRNDKLKHIIDTQEKLAASADID